MSVLGLHELHRTWGADFGEVNGSEVVRSYGDPVAEAQALRGSVGLVDLSYRSRICLLGADRQRFLHGQVTNDVKKLQAGEGCYAALVTAKGRMESDLNIHCLAGELLLDFEPGLTAAVTERLERYVIADDVQVVDVAPHYGLLSLQGPRALEAANGIAAGRELPAGPWRSVKWDDPAWGEIYCLQQPRLGLAGCDFYVPTAHVGPVAEKLLAAVQAAGGRPCGWEAMEMVRIEAGLPRFGQDMDASNLAPETGIEEQAISYAKGCYIGQEVIARIRTYGQVTRALRGLRLADNLSPLPVKGAKLFFEGREVGYITSAVASARFGRNIALGYVRKEHNQAGTMLDLAGNGDPSQVRIVALPFAEAELAVEN